VHNTEFKNKIIVGTQYYRQPTPLPDEWEKDLKAIRLRGIEYIQLRPQWKWHERREGEYQWDDIDRLLDLAEKHRLKVIFKFMLETAPQYIYDKYDGYRQGLDHERIWPVDHAAFYPGGWLPCFDNPKVMERAKLFVQHAVERYKNRPEIAVWHVWNEPRSRPVGECTCAYSQKSYYDYLKNEYGTVEHLNDFTGKCWAEFKDVGTPHSTSDFIGMFLWRKWAATRVACRVRQIFETIKDLDDSRPVIAHVGMPSVTQDVMGDTSDDWLTRQGVDFYGTSFEMRYEHPALKDSTPFLTVDWMRSVSGDGYFWVNELYPSGGRWEPEFAATLVDSWFWTCLAGGAKGVVFWQYKKERIGFETNDAGMVEINGEENQTSLKLTDSIKNLNDISAKLANAKVPKSDFALIYDFDSDLLSAIEDSDSPKKGVLGMNSYKAAFRGVYHLFWRLGVRVEILSSHELEHINEFKVVYAPYMQIIDKKRADIFKGFVKGGGKLVADSGFALRDSNTWLHPTRPGVGMNELFGVVEKERIRNSGAKWQVSTVSGTPACESFLIRTSFNLAGGTEFMRYNDGEVAAVCNRFGEGESWMLGISPGISYIASGGREYSTGLLQYMLQALSLAPEHPTPAEDGICRRILNGAEGNIEFLFDINDSSKFSLNLSCLSATTRAK